MGVMFRIRSWMHQNVNNGVSTNDDVVHFIFTVQLLFNALNFNVGDLCLFHFDTSKTVHGAPDRDPLNTEAPFKEATKRVTEEGLFKPKKIPTRNPIINSKSNCFKTFQDVENCRKRKAE